MPQIKHSNLTLSELKILAGGLGKKHKKENLIIGLIGELGSGKTTFVKNFAKAFGINSITSPTFTIMGSYDGLYHLDFYRLKKLNELEAIGLQELLDQSDRTLLIEWVDKFPSIKNQCDLIINFKFSKNNKRDVAIKYKK